MHTRSTSSTTSRRPLTFDNDTGRVVNVVPRGAETVSTGLSGLGFIDWSSMVSDIGSMLKKGAEVYTVNAVNARLDTQQLKAQTAAELQKMRAAAEAQRIAAGAVPKTRPAAADTTATPWYSDPKIMLPIAGVLLGGLYFLRRRRTRRG